MTESKPKFKKGDVVVRNNNKPTASFESIKDCEKLEIKRLEKLSQVYFYTVTKTNVLNDSILFPQISFDEMYDLDVLYNRGLKINKILNEITKTKRIDSKRIEFRIS